MSGNGNHRPAAFIGLLILLGVGLVGAYGIGISIGAAIFGAWP